MSVAMDFEARLRAFVGKLDGAVQRQSDVGQVTSAVKRILESEEGIAESLPERFRKPCAERYARRLLHKDGDDRYTVVVMVWDAGQCTPLHDHSGTWCVECVASGKILVTRYDLVGSSATPLLEFREAGRIQAGRGEAGALIPPFEYHKIENPYPEQAITLHVYGGEMTCCSAFFPEGERYRRELRQLQYTD
jgi:predicted metal-dependent enzyme (double-stranded beta helix superfamily)